MMDTFSKIFITGTTGLFIFFLMILVDHPKRKQIGIILFGLTAMTIGIGGPLIFSGILLLFFPFIIFLDVKRLSWKKCLWFAGISYIVMFVVFSFCIDLIPFYYYPFFMAFYVIIARKNRGKTIDQTV